ncbi:MAG: hypothetical protein KAT04_02035, partial [Methylococcales bacterium]|nr:hypothetical protein [Methylococcales bacterium]
MSIFQKFMCLMGLIFLSSCVTQGGFLVRNDHLLARLSNSAIDFYEKNDKWPANTDEMNIYNLKSEFYIGQEKIRTIELRRPLTGNYEIEAVFADERVKQ